MNIGKAIYSKLSATSGITALTSTRIYPASSPPSVKTYPLIVYEEDEAEVQHHYTGNSNLALARVRIAAISETYEGADTVANLIRSALDNQGGTWGGVVVQGAFFENESTELATVPDSDTQYHIREQAYLIWFTV